jgi:hypothetical protein
MDTSANTSAETGADTGADLADQRHHGADGPYVMVVTDGSPAAGAAAARGLAMLPRHPEPDVAIATMIELDTDPYGGATGFAAPVLDADDLDELVHERRVEADAAIATTARAVGPRPVRHAVFDGRDELVDAAATADLVVIADRGRASARSRRSVVGDLLADGARVLVVPGESDDDPVLTPDTAALRTRTDASRDDDRLPRPA